MISVQIVCDNSAANKWTYVLATRAATGHRLGFACNDLMPEAIEMVQVFWVVDSGMVATLTRMLAADAGDFSVWSKLRHLRVTQGLCSADAKWQLATMSIVLSAVDELLFCPVRWGDTSCHPT